MSATARASVLACGSCAAMQARSTYVVETIAVADDYADADGIDVLTFWQAQEQARKIGGQPLPAPVVPTKSETRSPTILSS